MRTALTGRWSVGTIGNCLLGVGRVVAAAQAGSPRATVSFPAVKTNRGESSLHFIDFAMDPALYQSLYNQGAIRLIRF